MQFTLLRSLTYAWLSKVHVCWPNSCPPSWALIFLVKLSFYHAIAYWSWWFISAFCGAKSSLSYTHAHIHTFLLLFEIVATLPMIESPKWNNVLKSNNVLTRCKYLSNLHHFHLQYIFSWHTVNTFQRMSLTLHIPTQLRFSSITSNTTRQEAWPKHCWKSASVDDLMISRGLQHSFLSSGLHIYVHK